MGLCSIHTIKVVVSKLTVPIIVICNTGFAKYSKINIYLKINILHYIKIILFQMSKILYNLKI